MEPVAPSLELITRVRATLAAPLELGHTPWGRRRVIGITGGEFDVPLLSGRVLPGGADWQIVHEDGSATIDTRYTLETHDGGLVYVATRGCRTGPREVLQRIATGETVDPSEYYFRVSIQYETSAPDYEWLNWIVAVASALRLADQVEYDAYVVR
jgi:5-methylphenazine-1-carboxylate 1-monooxygenase